MTVVLRRSALFMLALAALACDPSDQCDPGYYEVHGACYPNPEDMPTDSDASTDDASSGDEDGGSELGDAEVEPPPSDPHEGFGEPCTEDADCANDLICGGEMLPYCTQVNCMGDSSICPSDWTCFDVTGLSPDPDVTSICLR